MTVCTGQVFEMAVKQFELIANYPEDTRRPKNPPADAEGICHGIVQGFGDVGSITALELHNMRAKVIGVRDHTGALYRPRRSIYHSWSDMLPPR
ncbi:hypothetical protein ACVWZ6_002264 [Bradyrhizobium sp. GM6.1]